MTTSRDIIGNVEERFELLKRKHFDWGSFYNGWIEGRFEMVRNDMEAESDVFARAIKLWGEDSQIDIAIEECAEIIKALCKLNRVNINDVDPSVAKKSKADAIDAVQWEIADAELSIQQLRMIFGESEIEDRRQKKLKRLRARVDFADGKNVCPYCGSEHVTWNWVSNNDGTVWWHECHECPGNPTFATKGKRGE